MAILQYFPEEFLELQQEITHHPALMKLIANHPVNEFEVRIAECAAYCGIILDDMYDEKDLAKLAGIITKELRKARVELVQDIMKPIDAVEKLGTGGVESSIITSDSDSPTVDNTPKQIILPN